MPRIPPTLLHHARRIDRLLPPLLPVCRDLQSSRNELRWLGEHAAEVVASQHAGTSNEKHLLRQYVKRRSKGEPLQYILGTEFFGHLEIKCRPGVLIPRLVDVFQFLSCCILISCTVDKKLLLLYLTLPDHWCSHGELNVQHARSMSWIFAQVLAAFPCYSMTSCSINRTLNPTLVISPASTSLIAPWG
jgi:hypothetical protein